MSNANTATFTTESFDKTLESTTDPVLIDFWAPWCPPCNALTPTIEQLADRYQGGAVVGKVNVDEEPGLAQRFGVQSIPTIVIVQGGEEKQRFVGVQSADVLAGALDEAGATVKS